MLGGSQQPTTAQLKGFRDLMTWMRARGVNTNNIRGHRDHISTSCPGTNLYNRVRSGNWGTGGSVGNPGGGGGGSTGGFGNNPYHSRPASSVQEAVNAMGYTPKLAVDGIYGTQTNRGVAWAQRTHLGLTGASADGKWGANTENAYLEYLEDDVPERNLYSTTSAYDQTIQPNVWTTVRFDRIYDNGSWRTKTPEPSFIFGPARYTASVGVRVRGLEKGQEFQMRLAYYRQASGGGWERYATMPINSPVHDIGQSHHVTSWSGEVSGSRRGRVRVEVTHFGAEPVEITFARAEALYWKQ